MLAKVASGVAIAAILALIVAGRGWIRERDARQEAERVARGYEQSWEGAQAALRELDSGAPERERIYVEVVREVAAQPLTPECARDPAYIAASAGMLRLRRAYCTANPARCAADVVPHSSDGEP